MSLQVVPHVTAESARCRDCGRYVWWLRHARTGKLAPIEQAPRWDGNVLVDGDTYQIAGKDDDSRRQRFVSHFASCPAAAARRRA